MKLEPRLLAVTENFKAQIPAEVFNTIVAAIGALMRSDTFKAALKPGDMLPSFALPDANGQIVSSRELLARGQLMLTFYRGDWCPYCNLALKALHDQLPVFRAAGTSLVAVSPQTPDHSLTTRERLELDYPVLSDVGNVLARQLGIVFSLVNELRPLYTNFGIDINSYNGDGRFELPLPATFLIGSDGKILERFLEIDYRKRIEPETAVSWVRTHAARQAKEETHMKTYYGRCHCGTVNFEVDTDLSGPFRCNCSLCSRRGTTIEIVPATRFRLISGEEALTKYGGRDFSKHFFCRTCGIQCFTRLTVNMKLENEPSIGVNLGCLNEVDLSTLEPKVFDGAHML